MVRNKKLPFNNDVKVNKHKTGKIFSVDPIQASTWTYIHGNKRQFDCYGVWSNYFFFRRQHLTNNCSSFNTTSVRIYFRQWLTCCEVDCDKNEDLKCQNHWIGCTLPCLVALNTRQHAHWLASHSLRALWFDWSATTAPLSRGMPANPLVGVHPPTHTYSNFTSTLTTNTDAQFKVELQCVTGYESACWSLFPLTDIITCLLVWIETSAKKSKMCSCLMKESGRKSQH